MKKIFIILLILFSINVFAQAQINPHAIGLRLGGDGDINGAEISYQHALGETNRLELDLGFGGNKDQSRFFVAGIYHWNWNITEGLNWYAGPGATFGFFSFDNDKTDEPDDNYFNIGIGGQVGIEYDFNDLNAPVLLSLDTRPIWDLIGDSAGFGWGVALSIRYTW